MSELLLVGCGKMGSAFLARWQSSASITVVDPSNEKYYASLVDLPKSYQPDIVLFAIKPQIMPDIVPAYGKSFGDIPLYLSIAAGKTLDAFADYLGADARVIRVMPNTPAMIGEGMSVLIANTCCRDDDKDVATKLFEKLGRVLWLENESLMDVVTAISGSGPAYQFLFMQSLVDAAQAQGMDAESAYILSVQTCLGAASLAVQSNDGLIQLREQVTSPGGTTEAALEILRHNDALQTLIERAVEAAIERAKILAK